MNVENGSLIARARKSLRVLGTLLALGLASPMVAEAQLYPKAAPPGSTFVRIFNGTAISGVEGYIGTQRQSALPAYTGGPFNFMPPGTMKVTAGVHSETYTFESDHFYSVVETQDGLKLFDLRGFQSQLKAMVVMFNLMRDATLSLKTADGKNTIFDAMEPYKGAQREVNPVNVALAIFQGDKKIADVPAQPFERGRVSSLIVAGTATSPIVSWGDTQ